MINLIIQKETSVTTPNRAHKDDAGIDFYLPNDLAYIVQNGKGINIEAFKDNNVVKTAIAIYPHESVLLPMGLRVKFDKGWSLFFVNRSGLATKKHLFRGACLVDSGYSGLLYVNLTNVSNQKQYLLPGEKLIQAMLLPVPKVDIEEGKVDIETERGEGGFGSTDKK